MIDLEPRRRITLTCSKVRSDTMAIVYFKKTQIRSGSLTRVFRKWLIPTRFDNTVSLSGTLVIQGRLFSCQTCAKHSTSTSSTVIRRIVSFRSDSRGDVDPPFRSGYRVDQSQHSRFFQFSENRSRWTSGEG